MVRTSGAHPDAAMRSLTSLATQSAQGRPKLVHVAVFQSYLERA